MKSRKLNIWITGFTSFFTDVSSEMVYPIISLYVKALGGGPGILGIIEGVAESSASLLKVFSGALADRVGKRKPVAIGGYTLSFLGKLLFYLAHSWSMIFAGRVTDRFGKGIRGAPRDAMIAESIGEEERGRAFGIHRSLDTAGAVLGSLSAYFIVTYLTGEKVGEIALFRKLIFISLIPALLSVLILFFSIETGRGRIKRRINLASFRELPLKLKLYFLFLFIFTMGNSSNQFIFLRASEKDIGLGVGEIILLYVVYNIVEAVVSYPAGYLSDKINRKYVISAGFFIYGLVYLMIALFPKLIWISMAIYGVYKGATEGVTRAFVSDLAPEDRRATILGLHSAIEGIGLLPASLLAGLLWDLLGPSAPFLFGGIAGMVAFFGILLAV